MTQQDTDFRILLENFEPAMQALRQLSTHPEKMSGASYANGKLESKHFSWVDMTYPTKTSLESMLKCWGWELEFDDSGNVCGIQFQRSKIGDEQHLFKALAPFVLPRCFIQMQGEDGFIWRWTFDGTTMTEKSAKITWE